MDDPKGCEYQVLYEPSMERMVKALKKLLDYQPKTEVKQLDNVKQDQKTA